MSRSFFVLKLYPICFGPFASVNHPSFGGTNDVTPFTHPVSDLAFVAARRSLNFATRLEIRLVR